MTLRHLVLRLYNWSLRAFPSRHRRVYASEMADAFEREFTRHADEGGTRTALGFAAAACVNSVTAGIGERRRVRRWRLGPAISSLDFVLAWRMILRHPGLSLVGVFGMAVGITIAAGAFTMIQTMTSTRLPFPDGERIVSLLNWDQSTSNRELRLVYDFEAWRGMTSFEDIAIARTVQRNLIAGGREPETVTIAEMSASAFRVTRVTPLRGRHLLPEDEMPGAPDVIVIGYGEWHRRFGGDPSIVGRTVQLGDTAHTVVGVMPEGFAMPERHDYWVPWRVDAAAYEPRTGPSVYVFARLAPGATLESAQAELDAVHARLASASPSTHERLRARVFPYTHAFNDNYDPDTKLALNAIQAAIVSLLVVVCVNVAILVYARTAARQGEIAVRGALGASRHRIVAQLFVEALLLAGLAGAAGVGLAAVALRQLDRRLPTTAGALPFWMSFELSTAGVLYSVGLALMAAAIVGVIPALKATGRDVRARLQTLSAGSGSGMQMGRVWTGLVIAQVAFTVAVLPASMFHAWTSLSFRTGDPGFASGEFLTADVRLDRSALPPTAAADREFSRRFASAHVELDRRLREQGAVTAVTFSMTPPGDERAMVAEVEGEPAPEDPVNYNIVEGSKRGHLVRFNRVATNFFEAFDIPVIMGRAFHTTDADAGARSGGDVVVVSRSLVDTLFGGANPLGRRIRYVGRARESSPRDVVLDRWYEIIGVVPDFPTLATLEAEPVSRVYHAAGLGAVHPMQMAVRLSMRDPAAFAGTVRTLGAAVDPELQLRDIATAEIALRREQGMMRFIGIMVVLAATSVLVLSAAGIHALMAFTVARRRREIGIRVALGADRRRILAGIFTRAIAQLGMGAAIGLAAALALEHLLEGETFQGQGAVILPLVVAVITAAGVIAAAGPARRGLAVQPMEALRDE